MEGERGTHLSYPASHVENLVVVQVNLIPLAEGEDAAAPGGAARSHLAKRAAWREAVARGEAGVEQDPTPIGPVVRVYEPASAGVTLDLRTGLMCEGGMPGAEEVRRFVVGGLRAPI
jgi:hypothetical protein